MGGTCTGSACAVNLFVSSVNINVFFSLTRALCYSGSRCTNVAVIDFHLDKLNWGYVKCKNGSFSWHGLWSAIFIIL